MIQLLPSHFIPPGSVKVTDKQSDAVAYLYNNFKGKPAVIAYHGKSSKADLYYWYSTEAERNRRVEAFFQSRRGALQAKAERKAKANVPHKLQLGHVLISSWGYDQTNVDFFQVTRLIGPNTVALRPIASNSTEDGANYSGKVIPSIDQFTGEERVHRVRYGDSVTIDQVRHARIWEGKPAYTSSYH